MCPLLQDFTQKFPKPALASLHPTLKEACEKGVYQCLLAILPKATKNNPQQANWLKIAPRENTWRTDLSERELDNLATEYAKPFTEATEKFIFSVSKKGTRGWDLMLVLAVLLVITATNRFTCCVSGKPSKPHKVMLLLWQHTGIFMYKHKHLFMTENSTSTNTNMKISTLYGLLKVSVLSQKVIGLCATKIVLRNM